jgi:hypothetical protein
MAKPSDAAAGRRLCAHREQERKAATRVIAQTIRAGAASYDRMRDLPGLIRFDPLSGQALDDVAVETIVARLERALRAERQKARSGHWTYDLNRHIALRQAHRAETERLEITARRA